MDLSNNKPAPLVYKAYSSFIAIDWISNNLYYTSSNDSIIYVCDLPNALNCAIVLKLDQSKLRDIVLHPMKGLFSLYYDILICDVFLYLNHII